MTIAPFVRALSYRHGADVHSGKGGPILTISPQRVLERVLAHARAWSARRRPGVTIGRGARFGKGVSVNAAPGATVRIGERVEIGSGTHVVAAGGVVEIGDDVFISGMCIIAARESIIIGSETMIAEMVCIRDHDHDPDFPPRSGRVLVEPVHIGARVWLASKSSVVRGGQVEDDSVVGAHALVNRPIPAGVIAAGVPARVVRARR